MVFPTMILSPLRKAYSLDLGPVQKGSIHAVEILDAKLDVVKSDGGMPARSTAIVRATISASSSRPIIVMGFVISYSLPSLAPPKTLKTAIMVTGTEDSLMALLC